MNELWLSSYKKLVSSVFNYNIEKLWAINRGNWQFFVYKFEYNYYLIKEKGKITIYGCCS